MENELLYAKWFLLDSYCQTPLKIGASKVVGVTFHRQWNWIIAINGPNTRIESTGPPRCFNNQLPEIHCTLKYIMYDTLKCTLQTLHPFLFQYNHYDLRNVNTMESQLKPSTTKTHKTAGHKKWLILLFWTITANNDTKP